MRSVAVAGSQCACAAGPHTTPKGHIHIALRLQCHQPREGGDDGGAAAKVNTDLIEGVRKFINVRDLDIDLIDRINPFEAAYAVLAKTMDEKSLRQIQASIAGKNIKLTEEDARELAKRALQFKNERGRVPDINSADAWEKRMAEGVAAFARYRAQAKAAQAQGASGNG